MNGPAVDKSWYFLRFERKKLSRLPLDVRYFAYETSKEPKRPCAAVDAKFQSYRRLFFLIHRPRRQTRRRRYSTSCYGASSSLLLEARYRNRLKWSTTHWVSRYLGKSLPSILSAGNRSVMWGDSVTVLTCVHHDSVTSDLSRCYFPLGRGALKTWKAMVVEIKWDFFPISKWKL